MGHRIHADIVDKGILTPREAEILRYLCEGLMRKEIAKQLSRTPSTVSRHIESIALKLEAHSTAEIVAKAVAKGMVQLSLKLLLVAVMVGCTYGDIDIRRPPRQQHVRALRVARSYYY